MVQHQINSSGTCTTCQASVNEKQYVECFICDVKLHADCGGATPFCNKTFLKSFKALQSNKNFFFVCDHCQTNRENVAASTLKEQLADVVTAVAQLTREVKELKNEKVEGPSVPEKQVRPTAAKQPIAEKEQSVWTDGERMKKVKQGVTVCIKNDSESVDVNKVKEVVVSHGVQVMKASVNKKNGDLYIDLPNKESRDKLIPILNEADIDSNQIIAVKQKLPTISIRNVVNYVDEYDFVAQVKKQNPLIKEKMEEKIRLDTNS